MQILRAKMIEIELLFNFMDFPGSWLRSVESALNQPVGIVHRESEQCIAFECDRFKKWKHMAAAEINGDWGQKKVMIAMMKTSRMRKNLSMSSLYLRLWKTRS